MMRKLFGEPAVAFAAPRGRQLYYLDQAVSVEVALARLITDPGGVSCEGDLPFDDLSALAREQQLVRAEAEKCCTPSIREVAQGLGEDTLTIYIEVRDFQSLEVVEVRVVRLSEEKSQQLAALGVLPPEGLELHAQLRAHGQGVPVWGILFDAQARSRCLALALTSARLRASG